MCWFNNCNINICLANIHWWFERPNVLNQVCKAICRSSTKPKVIIENPVNLYYIRNKINNRKNKLYAVAKTLSFYCKNKFVLSLHETWVALLMPDAHRDAVKYTELKSTDCGNFLLILGRYRESSIQFNWKYLSLARVLAEWLDKWVQCMHKELFPVKLLEVHN